MRNIKYMNTKINEMNESDINKLVSGADVLAEQIPNIEKEIAIDIWDLGLNEDMALRRLPNRHDRNGASACHALVLASAAAIMGDITLNELVKIVTDVYSVAASDAKNMCARLNSVDFYGLKEKYDYIHLDDHRRVNYKRVLGLLYAIDTTVSMAKA